MASDDNVGTETGSLDLRQAGRTVRLTGSPTPLERFIAEHVEPRYHELNRWNSTVSHLELLRKAARRKKIHIKKISATHRILFHSGVAVGGLDTSMTTLVSEQAVRVARSKQLVKRYLRASEVPAPRGKTFHISQTRAASSYMEHLGTAVTIKPAIADPREGVITALRNEAQFLDAWPRAAEACSAKGGLHQQIIVEQHCEGLDLRTYVVGERVVAAVVRIPLYIVGDGSSTVGELADAELDRREENAYLKPRRPEVTDEFLAPMSITHDQILPSGRIQILTPIADTRRGGGIAVDVLPLLGPELRELALDALWSVPGMGAAAVDILTPSLDSAAGAAVIELDPWADLVEFRQPAYGKGRMPHDHLMDQILKHAPL